MDIFTKEVKIEKPERLRFYYRKYYMNSVSVHRSILNEEFVLNPMEHLKRIQSFDSVRYHRKPLIFIDPTGRKTRYEYTGN